MQRATPKNKVPVRKLDVERMRTRIALLAHPVSEWAAFRDARVAQSLVLSRLAALPAVGKTEKRARHAMVARAEKTACELQGLFDAHVGHVLAEDVVDVSFIADHIEEINAWDDWKGTPPSFHELAEIVTTFNTALARIDFLSLVERIRKALERRRADEAAREEAEQAAQAAIARFTRTRTRTKTTKKA